MPIDEWTYAIELSDVIPFGNTAIYLTIDGVDYVYYYSSSIANGVSYMRVDAGTTELQEGYNIDNNDAYYCVFITEDEAPTQHTIKGVIKGETLGLLVLDGGSIVYSQKNNNAYSVVTNTGYENHCGCSEETIGDETVITLTNMFAMVSTGGM